jgi:hypothetical protein
LVVPCDTEAAPASFAVLLLSPTAATGSGAVGTSGENADWSLVAVGSKRFGLNHPLGCGGGGVTISGVVDVVVGGVVVTVVGGGVVTVGCAGVVTPAGALGAEVLVAPSWAMTVYWYVVDGDTVVSEKVFVVLLTNPTVVPSRTIS